VQDLEGERGLAPVRRTGNCANEMISALLAIYVMLVGLLAPTLTIDWPAAVDPCSK
jgi:hypothetical protein